jgi:hypothetical protein
MRKANRIGARAAAAVVSASSGCRKPEAPWPAENSAGAPRRSKPTAGGASCLPGRPARRRQRAIHDGRYDSPLIPSNFQPGPRRNRQRRPATSQNAPWRGNSGDSPVRALAGAGPAAGVAAVGTAAGLSGGPYSKRPDLAASEMLVGSTPGFTSWLTGSQEADLRLIADDARAARRPRLSGATPPCTTSGRLRRLLQAGRDLPVVTVVGEMARSLGGQGER